MRKGICEVGVRAVQRASPSLVVSVVVERSCGACERAQATVFVAEVRIRALVDAHSGFVIGEGKWIDWADGHASPCRIVGISSLGAVICAGDGSVVGKRVPGASLDAEVAGRVGVGVLGD